MSEQGAYACEPPGSLALDTGLACLTMLARLHNVAASPEQPAHEFAEDGRAERLAARKLGLKAESARSKPERLAHTPLPAIAASADGRLFSVARIDAGKAPIHGPQTQRPEVLSFAELEPRWSGDSVARARELENIRSVLTGKAITLNLGLLLSAVFVPVMFCYSGWLTLLLVLVLVLSLPLYLLISLFITPLLRARARARARARPRRAMLDLQHESEQRAAALNQELKKAEQRNRLMALTAPVDGTVQQLAIHTQGGAVTEAQPLMVIVPSDEPVEVEAMLENKDIGFVRPGQEVEIKVETFTFPKYGVVHGSVTSISNDAIEDEKLGLVYSARIQLKENRIRVNDQEIALSPGMAVRAEVKTDKRKVIDYFLSPLKEYQDESLGER